MGSRDWLKSDSAEEEKVINWMKHLNLKKNEHFQFNIGNWKRNESLKKLNIELPEKLILKKIIEIILNFLTF